MSMTMIFLPLSSRCSGDDDSFAETIVDLVSLVILVVLCVSEGRRLVTPVDSNCNR